MQKTEMAISQINKNKYNNYSQKCPVLAYFLYKGEITPFAITFPIFRQRRTKEVVIMYPP